jgi:inner membrane protein
MMAPTHMLAGATLAGYIVGPSPGIIAASTFFALISDIDTPESGLGHRMPVIPTLINLIIGHRTITHSLIFLLLGYFLFGCFLNHTIALAWVIGVGSHILMDILTPQGVQLFWPYPFYVRFKAINTGGIIEVIFLFCLLFLNFGTAQGRTLWGKVFHTIYNAILSLF